MRLDWIQDDFFMKKNLGGNFNVDRMLGNIESVLDVLSVNKIKQSDHLPPPRSAPSFPT